MDLGKSAYRIDELSFAEHKCSHSLDGWCWRVPFIEVALEVNVMLGVVVDVHF